MNKRKIAVVTSTRAEFGLLTWVMREIQQDPDLQLQVIVTGMHLSLEFGLTYQHVKAAGFSIDAKVEMLLSSNSAVGVAKSTGLGVISFADTLDQLKPDVIVILGDRFEMMAVAQAAMLLKIPVAHIHGGEVTEGVLDESIRHAITKMSHIHFPVTEVYRQRLLQLGEQPNRVFNFGAPGLDHIHRTTLLTREQLSEQLGIQFREKNILVTYHPVTLLRENAHRGLLELFKALDQFSEATIIFTKSNADEGGRLIGTLVDEYTATHNNHCYAFVALGLERYLSLAKVMDMVVGNSSSGLIEVPHVKTATVNIGDRQRGRLLASSVINCEEQAQSIVKAIHVASSPEFQHSLKNIVSPYGTGNASYQIKEVLKHIDLENLLVKRFYDLPHLGEHHAKQNYDYC